MALAKPSRRAIANAKPRLVRRVSPAEIFRRMSSDTWVTRVVTLADTGITNPLVLGYSESAREIALPVPPGVPIVNGTVQMDASFVRADGGRTTLILSLDGFPVTARPVRRSGAAAA